MAISHTDDDVCIKHYRRADDDCFSERWRCVNTSPANAVTAAAASVPPLCLGTCRAGYGIAGKCLGPTTSKGATKDGCKIFWTWFLISQSVDNVSHILSAKLSIFCTKTSISRNDLTTPFVVTEINNFGIAWRATGERRSKANRCTVPKGICQP